MPADSASTIAGFSQGLQVEPNAIERELKRLWKEGEGVVTRASLMNFAIYSEAPDALETNSALMAEITRDHACRGILIAAQPSQNEASVDSWISAHCHLGGSGGRHICCEQIAFLLKGKACRWIPNVVFSHLDSDLPLYFWWQGELPCVIDKQLWSWVNNLVYDSDSWTAKARQFEILSEIQEAVPFDLVLSDLNWARQVYLRLATAHFFDHEGGAERLREFQTLKIVHHPKSLFSALLYTGWLAAQLGWRFAASDCNSTRLVLDTGSRNLEVQLEVADGAPISQIIGKVGGGEEFEIRWENGAEFLNVVYHGKDTVDLTQAMPAGRQDPASLVIEELRRGGKHRIYSKTIRLLTPLLDPLGL